MKLIWSSQNNSQFWQNEFVSWITLTYSTSGALYWMKQLLIIETNSVMIGWFSLMSIFRLHPALKKSFDYNIVGKNRFQRTCFFGILDLLYVRWNKNLNLVEPLVMGTRTWSFYFVISTFLDYTQHYMMLLEQCGLIVVKGLSTLTWLDEDQIHVCSVTWLDYSFAFR